MTTRLTMAVALLLSSWPICFAALPGAAAEPNVNPRAIANACSNRESAGVLRQKLLAPIREEILRRTSPEAVTVEEDDLEIQSCLPEDSADFAFTVKHAEYDAVRDVTVFWLASSQRGNTRPALMITVHKRREVKVTVARHDVRSGQAVSAADFAESTRSSGNLLAPASQLWQAAGNRISAEPKKAETKTNPRPSLLVKVGVPAELLIRGKNFQGRMSVIPLESGSNGDELRVRDPASRKILRAKVTSVNQVEEDF